MKNVIRILIVSLSVILNHSCEKDNPAIPVISTTAITEITQTTATTGGNVLNDGGAAITSRGVCWSISPDPTIENSKTNEIGGKGSFTSNITQLKTNTVYYVRAYATNSAGTGYGITMSFTTLGEALSVLTNTATNISTTEATLNATVTADFLLTEIAFEYGTTTSYGQTIMAVKSPLSCNCNNITDVIADISELTPGTNYHFRVKATNSFGTTFGNDITFSTTFNGVKGTVMDIDGNLYNTIGIGYQVWMVENLKTTKYNDGTTIPNIMIDSVWSDLIKGAYCDYGNDPANSDTYGRLYNWYAVASANSKNICPTGWRVSDNSDWTKLITFTGGERVAGIKLKEGGPAHWIRDKGATNETGFTALPGGLRTYAGTYDAIKISGYWWTSTESGLTNSWVSYMDYSHNGVYLGDGNKNNGFSVRCLKDLSAP